jgi:hypothetical protein
MRIFRPVVIGFTALVVASFLFGQALDFVRINLAFSATFYLFLCFAQILHSVEEYMAQFWLHIAEIPVLRNTKRGDKEPTMDRAFFIVFNVALNLIMLSFYWPISHGASWSLLFGLGMACVGVGNGFLHGGMAAMQRKYFSGCMTASLTFISGILVLTSITALV